MASQKRSAEEAPLVPPAKRPPAPAPADLARYFNTVMCNLFTEMHKFFPKDVSLKTVSDMSKVLIDKMPNHPVLLYGQKVLPKYGDIIVGLKGKPVQEWDTTLIQKIGITDFTKNNVTERATILEHVKTYWTRMTAPQQKALCVFLGRLTEVARQYVSLVPASELAKADEIHADTLRSAVGSTAK
jgi:hypothetical protein